MNYEEVKLKFNKILIDLKKEDIYEESIKRADYAKSIAENSSLFEENLVDLAFLVGLTFKIDIEILIDQKKLKEITNSPIYDKSVQLVLYFYDKKEYPEYLTKGEKILIDILKDIEIIEIIKNKSNEIINLDKEEAIRDEFINILQTNNYVPIEKANNELEKIIFTLSNVFNIKYRYSFYIIENNKYIDKTIEQLNNLTNQNIIKKVYAIFKKFTTKDL